MIDSQLPPISTTFVEKYETANWSLRQGDEEVNKRIKHKNIYLNE